MDVTVIGVEGLGTDHAVIRAEHKRENAKEFCEKYSEDHSEECIEQTLREVRINDEVRANCRTGWFTTFSGERFRFIGKSKSKSEIAPKYVIIGPSGPLDGSSASSYPTALELYAALCPGQAQLEY